MYTDTKKLFFWSGMKHDIIQFVARCLECQQVKVDHCHPADLLQPHDIPMTKWKIISMEFVIELPLTSQRHNVILVVVDKLTKNVHFIPVRDTYKVADVARVFINEIIRFHGVPKKIISDRDSRFTSIIWTCMQSALGTQLNLSTTYHPDTDGQTERVNQVLEDMLRMYVMDQQSHWEKYLSLIEFAYNNNYQSSIRMPPFEALHGRPCRTLLSWDMLEDRMIVGPELIQEMEEQVKQIRQRLKEAQDRQKSYVDAHRTDRKYEVGDQVFVRIKPNKSAIRFKKGTKLSPRFIGPFKFMERVGLVIYRLALPPHLHKVHNVSDEGIISVKPLRILERRVPQLRNRLVEQVKVQRDKYSPRSATWEDTETICQKYPNLRQF
eukprot:PITA_12907